MDGPPLPEAARPEDAASSISPDADTLRQVATQLVNNLDLHQCSVKECRAKIAAACGLERDGLDARKDEINFKKSWSLSTPRNQASRQAVAKSLVWSQRTRGGLTWSLCHTQTKKRALTGRMLVPPGTYTRMEVRDFFLGALLSAQANRDQPLAFTSMAVFQESHATGQVHYHVALSADKCFRYAPLKRHLLAARSPKNIVLAKHPTAKGGTGSFCLRFLQNLRGTQECLSNAHPQANLSQPCTTQLGRGRFGRGWRQRSRPTGPCKCMERCKLLPGSPADPAKLLPLSPQLFPSSTIWQQCPEACPSCKAKLHQRLATAALGIGHQLCCANLIGQNVLPINSNNDGPHVHFSHALLCLAFACALAPLVLPMRFQLLRTH